MKFSWARYLIWHNIERVHWIKYSQSLLSQEPASNPENYTPFCTPMISVKYCTLAICLWANSFRLIVGTVRSFGTLVCSSEIASEALMALPVSSFIFFEDTATSFFPWAFHCLFKRFFHLLLALHISCPFHPPATTISRQFSECTILISASVSLNLESAPEDDESLKQQTSDLWLFLS